MRNAPGRSAQRTAALLLILSFSTTRGICEPSPASAVSAMTPEYQLSYEHMDAESQAAFLKMAPAEREAFLNYIEDSCRKSCVANRNTIDKVMGVWESVNVSVPAKVEATCTLNVRGEIIAEQGLSSLAAKDDESKLKKGSNYFLRTAKDEVIFRCPLRVRQVAGKDSVAKSDDAHYRWETHLVAIPELDGRTRGTRCLWCSPPAPPAAVEEEAEAEDDAPDEDEESGEEGGDQDEK